MSVATITWESEKPIGNHDKQDRANYCIMVLTLFHKFRADRNAAKSTVYAFFSFNDFNV